MSHVGDFLVDNSKVGKLILRLRREKSLTQAQLAEKMNISDKAISKWERGMGCPDVSLLRELSEHLGVNIEKILLGELEQNSVDSGNIKKIKFFVCPTCGNIMTATGEAELSCCGRKLEPLTAKKAADPHTAQIEDVEDDYYITFCHEMTKQHFIRFVAYVKSDRMTFVRLYPEQMPEARTRAMRGGTLYFYCSKHGLFYYNK